MATVSQHNLQRIEDFRARCCRFQGLWHSLVVRLAWTRVAEIDMVAHLHASLEVTEPDAVSRPPHDPSLEGYKAEFHVMPATRLDGLLDELAAGSVTFGGRTLAVGGFRSHEPDEFRLLDFADSGFIVRNAQHWLANRDGAEAYLHLTCNNLYEATKHVLYTEELTARWNGLPAPFCNIDDVLASFFGLPLAAVQNLRLNAFATFRALVPIRLTDRTGFDGKDLRIEVAAPNTTERDAVALGLVANTGESRRQLTLGSWEKRDSGLLARLSLPADDLHTYTLFLTYKGVCLETNEDSNPALRPTNPVLAAHRLFERSPDFTKRALRGEGKDRAGDFERAVGWLLYACGLPPLDYSSAGREEIDLVAVLPDKRLAVCVECTTGLPDLKNKLTKLYERSEALRKTLGDFEVVRAVATCKPEEEVPEDQFKIAVDHRTALLTRERLQELERKAHSRIAAAETVAFIKSRIPMEGDIGEAVRKARGLSGRGV